MSKYVFTTADTKGSALAGLNANFTELYTGNFTALAIANDGLMGWVDGTGFIRPTANTIAQRNGANGQIFLLSRTFTDDTNFSQLKIDASTGFYVAIGADEQGAGVGVLTEILMGIKINMTNQPIKFSIMPTSDPGHGELWVDGSGFVRYVQPA